MRFVWNVTVLTLACALRAAEEPEGCNHCGQGKVCSQCGTTSTPQWRTGPKGAPPCSVSGVS